jgi:hypothetical protein
MIFVMSKKAADPGSINCSVPVIVFLEILKPVNP